MALALSEISGCPVFICKVGFSDWLRAFSAKGWLKILLKLKNTVDMVVKTYPDKKIILLGHSAGGLIGRLYLSPQPFQGHRFNGLENISHLITLGSPHYGKYPSPMRMYVQKTLPDAYFGKYVKYVSVAGTAVDTRKNRLPITFISRLCYRYLGGNGRTAGDGLVPVECALLKDSVHIVLEGVGHPFIFSTDWYGRPKNVREWWANVFS
jgi:pimeloyl-ACP methyl ester carboxylesterase